MLVETPVNREMISFKWKFKVKFDNDGDSFNGHFVATAIMAMIMMNILSGCQAFISENTNHVCLTKWFKLWFTTL